MKKILCLSAVALMLSTAFVSCKKAALETVDVANTNGLSGSEINLIKAAGFNASWATKQADGRFLIEDDILLSTDQLNEMGGVTPAYELVFPTQEHYRTTNLVSTNGGVRTLDITIGASFPVVYILHHSDHHH